MRADRTVLSNIIRTWKELKSLREFQNHSNTAAKLVIKKYDSFALSLSVEIRLHLRME